LEAGSGTSSRSEPPDQCAWCVRLQAAKAREGGETDERSNMVAVWREADCFGGAESGALAWCEAVTLLPESGAPMSSTTSSHETSHPSRSSPSPARSSPSTAGVVLDASFRTPVDRAALANAQQPDVRVAPAQGHPGGRFRTMSAAMPQCSSPRSRAALTIRPIQHDPPAQAARSDPGHPGSDMGADEQSPPQQIGICPHGVRAAGAQDSMHDRTRQPNPPNR
jgi:hypothetical protein